jgi:hypothetical protein
MSETLRDQAIVVVDTLGFKDAGAAAGLVGSSF